MFHSFENFIIIYLFILACTCAPLHDTNAVLEPNTDIVPEPNTKRKLQEEIAPVLEKFDEYLNTADENAKQLQKVEFLSKLEELGRKAIKAENLLIQQGALMIQKELAEEWTWFELMRQQIEYYEENNFPQPYDSDFEEKKIIWDTKRLKGKTNHELHEERRYQKFKYYLENPPNESVKKFRSRLDEANVSVEMFSKRIARAYRLISARIHDGFMKRLGKNLEEFFHQEDVFTAIGIFLDEVGVSKKLIQQIKNNCEKRVYKNY